MCAHIIFSTDHADDVEENEDESCGITSSPNKPQGGSTGSLWVEKYAPQRYTDLLSDEVISSGIYKSSTR